MSFTAAAVGLGLVLIVAGCSSSAASSPPETTTTVVPDTQVPAATTPPATDAPTTTTSLPPPLPTPSPGIASPGTNKLIVVGDSVILGAKAEVPQDLVGWDVTFDARESRFITNGLDVLKAHKNDADKLAALAQADLEKAYADAGLPAPPPPPPLSITDVLGRVAVIHLCTNYEKGGGFANQIDRIMDWLKDLDRVVWVTCAEWSSGPTEANQAIRDAGAHNPKIVVADWAAFTITPGYTYNDHIHLQQPGRLELAKLVAAAVGPAPTPLPPAPTTTRPKPTTTTTTEAPPVVTDPPA